MIYFSDDTELFIVSLTLLTTITPITFYISKTERDVNETNRHINVDKIKFGMNEQEVIQLWGNGVFREGFGGYGREYNNKRVELSFLSDEDNDLYGTVSGIRISNQSYNIFGITSWNFNK